jgi:hypothetical protein
MARLHTGSDEPGDADFGQILKRGAIIGIPLAYVLVLVLALPAVGWPLAPLIAVEPAAMGGPWLGGVIMLLKHSAEFDARVRINAGARTDPGARMVALPSRPEPDHRQAA